MLLMETFKSIWKCIWLKQSLKMCELVTDINVRITETMGPMGLGDSGEKRGVSDFSLTPKPLPPIHLTPTLTTHSSNPHPPPTHIFNSHHCHHPPTQLTPPPLNWPSGPDLTLPIWPPPIFHCPPTPPRLRHSPRWCLQLTYWGLRIGSIGYISRLACTSMSITSQVVFDGSLQIRLCINCCFGNK